MLILQNKLTRHLIKRFDNQENPTVKLIDFSKVGNVISFTYSMGKGKNSAIRECLFKNTRNGSKFYHYKPAIISYWI